jgi:perosamine synthetase
MGAVQVRKLPQIVEAKRTMAARYRDVLNGLPGLELPTEANWAKHVYWMYGIVIKPEFGMTRDELSTRLAQKQIETRTFFCPMNSQPCFKGIAKKAVAPTPVADMLWQCGLYLPSSQTLTTDKIKHIGATIGNIHWGRC